MKEGYRVCKALAEATKRYQGGLVLVSHIRLIIPGSPMSALEGMA